MGNYEAAAWLLQRLSQRNDVDDPAVMAGMAQAHATLALIDILGGAGHVVAEDVEPAAETSPPAAPVRPASANDQELARLLALIKESEQEQAAHHEQEGAPG